MWVQVTAGFGHLGKELVKVLNLMKKTTIQFNRLFDKVRPFYLKAIQLDTVCSINVYDMQHYIINNY